MYLTSLPLTSSPNPTPSILSRPPSLNSLPLPHLQLAASVFRRAIGSRLSSTVRVARKRLISEEERKKEQTFLQVMQSYGSTRTRRCAALKIASTPSPYSPNAWVKFADFFARNPSWVLGTSITTIFEGILPVFQHFQIWTNSIKNLILMKNR